MHEELGDVPRILTTNATFQCIHLGEGEPIPTNFSWTIDGGIVLRDGDSGLITGCLLVKHPCTSFQLTSMKLNATKLDGANAMLETDFIKTDTGVPMIVLESHLHEDRSIPAPIPEGADTADIPLGLLFGVPPVVQASPTSLSVSKTSGAGASASFSLLCDFPLKWELTFISEPDKTSTDIKDGDPSGILVSPSGGTWTTPSLDVSLTLLPSYVAGLSPGIYHFYMVGVSERGKFGHAEFQLTVTPT